MPIIFLKKGDTSTIPMHEIKDLGKEIDYQVKIEGENYSGAHDFYVFNIDGKKISLISKLSFEEVWQTSVLEKSPQMFFEQKDEGSWEQRKWLRVASLITAYNTKPGGGMMVGQKDPVLQAKLCHDFALYHLAILFSQLEIRKMKSSKLNEMFEGVKFYVRQTKDSFDLTSFNFVIKHIENELPKYQRRSLGNRLFKK